MRIAFLGTPEFAIPSLQALLEDSRIQVDMVITQPDRKRFRNRLTPTPVKKLAGEYNIPVFTPERLNSSDVVDRLIAQKPDFLVVIAYGQLIGKRLLEAFPDRIINIHGSLLPKYRGAAPIQRALLDGEPETGLTAMLIEKEMDAGDMLAKKVVPISDEDDLDSLTDKLANAAPDLLLDTLFSFSDRYEHRRSQDPSEVTYAEKIEKEDGVLSFDQTTKHLLNQVRTLKNWPGARFRYHGIEYKVHQAHGEEGLLRQKPGTVFWADARGIAIQAGDGAFVIDVIQAPGRRAASCRDFLNGHDFPVGDQVEA